MAILLRTLPRQLQNIINCGCIISCKCQDQLLHQPPLFSLKSVSIQFDRELVHLLKDPPPYLKVREVKQWYVDYLTKMSVKEDDDHEDLTVPLAIASTSECDFSRKT